MAMTFMHFIKQALRWMVFLVPTIGAFVYSFTQLDNPHYWEGAVGNWLATLLGIVVGVPVALHLERSRTSKDTQEKRKELARVRVNTLILL